MVCHAYIFPLAVIAFKGHGDSGFCQLYCSSSESVYRYILRTELRHEKCNCMYAAATTHRNIQFRIVKRQSI